MTSLLETIVGYALPAGAEISCTNIGVRAPLEPFAQPRRALDEFVAFFVTDGEIHLTDEMPGRNESVTVRPGEIHVVAPRVWQSSSTPFAPGIRFLWLHFAVAEKAQPLSQERAAETARRQFAAGGAYEWLIPRHFALGEQAPWFAQLHDKAHEAERLGGLHDSGAQLLAGAFVFELQRRYALSFLSPGAVAPAVSIAAVHAQRAGVYIRLNAHRPLSARHVAAALGLNMAYLQRCFARETGQTLGEFIMQQKMESARRLLRDGSLSIEQVAQQCGFASSTYFGRMFQRAAGCTASEYRRRLRL